MIFFVWWHPVHHPSLPMCRPHCKTRLLPNKGTASEVAGIVSATIFRNTVKDNKIVTPKKKKKKKEKYEVQPIRSSYTDINHGL